MGAALGVSTLRFLTRPWWGGRALPPLALIISEVSTGKINRRQLEEVLRRAVELEAANAVKRDEDGLALLTEQDVVRLGEDAGLSGDSVQKALGELRRGQIRTAPDDDAIGRTFGACEVVVSREIPGPARPVERAVERFLREQLMVVRRHHGDRVEWEKARGLWPGLHRSLDFARRYAFGPVRHLETVINGDAQDGNTSVTFRIDLTELRRDRLVRAYVRAMTAFSIFGLGGMLFFPGFGLNDVVALLGGGAAGGGLLALERRRFDESRAEVTLAPERFLDLLARRRRRALEIPPAEEAK
jgi:hypothetical protein